MGHNVTNDNKTVSIPPGEVWEFDGGFCPGDFFNALKLLGAGYGLYIESSSISKDLVGRLRAFEVKEICRIRQGTIWPKPVCLHISLHEESIGELVAISESHAVPEYADHVVVYNGGVVIEAYDFSLSPFQMSESVPESVVQEFSALLRVGYKRGKVTVRY